MSRTALLFCLIFSLLILNIHALSIKIEPHREECFYEKIETQNVKVTVDFQVASGGFLDIDTKILSPTNQILHHLSRQTEHKLTFNANEIGFYKLCFSNQMSTMTPKIVSFDITVGELGDPDVAKLDQLDPIEQAIMKLSEGMATVQSEQRHLKTRERIHRDLTEYANEKMLWWGFFELIVMLCMGIFQVFYLKRVLDSKGRV